MDGMTGSDAYGASRAFTKLVAMGLTSVNVDNVNKTITFTLVADGSQHTLQFDELTTTTTREIVASITQGNVYPGKVYPVGTEYETIIEDLITQYLKPEVKLTIEPATTLYEIVNDTVDKITMYATVTKKTSDVAQVEFFVNGTSKNVVTNNVSSGGLFEYIFEPATPINADATFKVTATDTKNESASATKTIKFVAKSYYGIVDALSVGEQFVSFYHNNANQNRFGIDVNYGNLIHELRITKCLDADLTANYATVTAFMNTGCVMSRIYYKTYSTDWTSTKDYVESLT